MRRDVYWIVVGALCAAGLLWAAKQAYGETLIHRQGATTIRLFDKPCTEPTLLERFLPPFRPGAKAAMGDFILRRPDGEIVGAQDGLKGCWVDLPDGRFGTLWEDGDAFSVDPRAFQPEGI
jgi:hypothetical protein